LLNATGSSDCAAVEGGQRFRTKQTAARVAAESETRLRVVAQILALLKLERLATQCGTAALARARASHSVELRKYFRLPSNLKRASGIPGPGNQGTEPPMGTGIIPGKSGVVVLAGQWGWTPDPRQTATGQSGMGVARAGGWTPDPRQIGRGSGVGMDPRL
jgi:hypothetical protein